MYSDNKFILKHLKTAFNKTAHSYEAAAVIPKEVGSRLLEKLDFIKIEPKRILDIGAGTGLQTKLLQKRYPRAQVVSLDLAQMRLSYGKLKHSVVADAINLPFKDKQFDLIVSNLCFYWCPNIEKLLQEVNRTLKDDATFLFSTFGADTLKELRISMQAAFGTTPKVNLFYDMHDIGDLLLKAQFKDPVTDVETIALHYKNIATLLADLKAMGETNHLSFRDKGLCSKTKLAAGIAYYEANFNDNGIKKASFEVIYGHAMAAQLKSFKQQDGSIAIPISSIRRTKS